MKNVLTTFIFLLSLSMIFNINAQSLNKEVDNNFNITYNSPASCQMDFENKDFSVNFTVNYPYHTYKENVLIVKCSNSIPYTISHIPQDKYTNSTYISAMTGVSTNEKIHYHLQASDENRKTLGVLHTHPTFSVLGIGQEQRLNIRASLRIRDDMASDTYLKHMPVVDKYVGISTIKLSF